MQNNDKMQNQTSCLHIITETNKLASKRSYGIQKTLSDEKKIGIDACLDSQYIMVWVKMVLNLFQ